MLPRAHGPRRHLRLMAGEDDPVVCWQVFPDYGKERKGLAASFHGRRYKFKRQLQKQRWSRVAEG